MGNQKINGDLIITGSIIDANNVSKPTSSLVTGPSSSANNAIAIYDGATGKIIKDSGITITQNTGYGVIFEPNRDLRITAGPAASSILGIKLSTSTSGQELTPITKYDGQYDYTKSLLGTSTLPWTNLYLSGNLSDGTNSTTIANIVTKNTDQAITGQKTFKGTLTLDEKYNESTQLYDDPILNIAAAGKIQSNFSTISFSGGLNLSSTIFSGKDNRIDIIAAGEEVPNPGDWKPGIKFKATDYSTDNNGDYIFKHGYSKLPTNDGSTSSNYYTIATTHDLTGFVTGPASSSDTFLAVFDGTTGKAIKQTQWLAKVESSTPILQANNNSGIIKAGREIRLSVSDYSTGWMGASLFSNPISGGAWSFDFSPLNTTYPGDLGTSSRKWTNLYLSGNLSDGTNSVTIAQLAASLAIPGCPSTTNGNYILRATVNNGTVTYIWVEDNFVRLS